jgi:hypothetical protein
VLKAAGTEGLTAGKRSIAMLTAKSFYFIALLVVVGMFAFFLGFFTPRK